VTAFLYQPKGYISANGRHHQLMVRILEDKAKGAKCESDRIGVNSPPVISVASIFHHH